MSIRLITLGSLRCVSAGQSLSSLLAQRQRLAVLIYLAMEKESTRDQVLNVFWPDRDTEKARQALNQALFELRQALDDEWLQRQGDHLVVTDALELDANRFVAALDRGAIEDGLALYSGEFLKAQYLVDSTQFEEWVGRQRARLARLHRKARKDILREYMERGDITRAVQEARRWVELDPMEDEAQHRLIELLAEYGERTEALRQFEAYSRLLKTEGLEPLDETMKFVERIRSRELPAVKELPSQRRRPSKSISTIQEVRQLPRTSEMGRENAPVDPPTKSDTTTVASHQPSAVDDRHLAADLSPEFEVLRKIGEGWWAHVYLARERALQRLVAIKVLRPQLAHDKAARARFEREARAAAGLVHPNVVAVHSVGALTDGRPYMLMEYVPGRNLADTLAAEGALTEAEACSVLGQLAAALAAAHAHGIIHRDVRPPNIVWTRDADRVVLMDFGVAAVAETGSDALSRLTRPGEVAGDPAYMSPEQLRGESLSVASDIFSIGVLGYELLTLGRPYNATSESQSTWAQLNWEAEPLTAVRPNTTPSIADLLQRCLAKKPEHRPSASQLARSFERIASEEGSAVSGRASDSLTPDDRSMPAVRLFFSELKRRRVYTVVLIYAVVAAALIKGFDILPVLTLPPWFYTALVLLVLGSFPIVVVLAWTFDIVRTGVHPAESIAPESYRSALRGFELSGFAVSLLLAAMVGWWILAS